MLKRLFCACQYILPQHLLSMVMGRLAGARQNWLKNTLIDIFCKAYSINLQEAVVTDAHAYPTFNDFFTRALQPGARVINPNPDSIVSPADGTVAQIGSINGRQLLQAKDMYFDLNSLFGGQTDVAAEFIDGTFATIYLAPHNYHRVHMPFTGTVTTQIYIPGKLFSVNRMTSELIPNLYARNERLVLVFDTATGPMAVILVGALIVGSMQTVWMNQPMRGSEIAVSHPGQPIRLEKGDELGRFLMGSTVILLFPQGKQEWTAIAANDAVQVGQPLGILRQT